VTDELSFQEIGDCFFDQDGRLISHLSSACDEAVGMSVVRGADGIGDNVSIIGIVVRGELEEKLNDINI